MRWVSLFSCLAAEDPDSRLYPGMTADISCEVGRREGVLKIANAALRFHPESNGGGGQGRVRTQGKRADLPRGA